MARISWQLHGGIGRVDTHLLAAALLKTPRRTTIDRRRRGRRSLDEVQHFPSTCQGQGFG